MSGKQFTYKPRKTRYGTVQEVYFAGRVVGYIDHRRGSKLYSIVTVEPDIRDWVEIKQFVASFDSREAAAWRLAEQAKVLG